MFLCIQQYREDVCHIEKSDTHVSLKHCNDQGNFADHQLLQCLLHSGLGLKQVVILTHLCVS